MWHMQSGDRVLDANEAKLVVEMAAVIVDELSDEADNEDRGGGWTGIKTFDRLPWSSRLQLLYDVLRALLDPNIPAPELTAFNEATVAAIFAELEECLQNEIESQVEGYSEAIPLPNDDDYALRRDVLACIDPKSVGDDWQPPAINSPDASEWSLVLAGLRDRILWDDDFEMYDPEKPLLPTTLASLDIDEEYFTSLPPKPSDEEADAIMDAVRLITHADVGRN